MPERFRLARLFDVVDPETGPRFADDHRREEDQAEVRRLLEFLYGGEALVRANSLSPDLVDRSRGKQVPIVTLTDGHWIWSGGHSYYLEEYGFALEPEFHEHIRAQGYRTGEPDEQTVLAALEYLRAEQARQQNG